MQLLSTHDRVYQKNASYPLRMAELGLVDYCYGRSSWNSCHVICGILLFKKANAKALNRHRNKSSK
jgi:hypothetical protein